MEGFRSIFIPILAYSVRSIAWVAFCICIGLFLGGLFFGNALDFSPLFAKKVAREVSQPVEAATKVLSPQASVNSCQQQVSAVMDNNQILFSVGKTDIKAASYEVLDQLSIIILKCSAFRISINGHTDNTGNSQLNTALSKRRAESVKNYFSRRGVSLSKILVVGYGSSQPIASNTTSQGRSKNRRIEITFSDLQKSYKVEIL